MKDWSTINLLKTKDYSAEKNGLNYRRRKQENAGAARTTAARTEGRAPSLRKRPVRKTSGRPKTRDSPIRNSVLRPLPEHIRHVFRVGRAARPKTAAGINRKS